MLYGWEDNRRFGIALARHHRLHGISTYPAMAREREMSSLPTLHWNTMASLPLLGKGPFEGIIY